MRAGRPQKAVCNGQRGLTREARRSGAGSQEHMRVTAPPEHIHMAPRLRVVACKPCWDVMGDLC